MPFLRLPALAALFLLIGASRAASQVDTEFWFAAPEISHNNLNYDLPILLRLAAQSEAATVTVSQPANPAFSPLVFEVPANTAINIPLSDHQATLENTPPNTVLNYGLHIVATAPVTVYYEVASLYCFCDPEIYVLKGRNGLGRDFFVPFQTYWANHPAYEPTPYSAFDIVATEDNTTVTILPTRDLAGRPAGVPYTITLNRGQTYSGRAAGQAPDDHPAGTRVTADKPVAITMKDDLLYSDAYGGCRDQLGDQIVPVSVIGTRYLVLWGFLNNQDKVFVLATEDETEVTVNGLPSATLSQSETLELNLSQVALFIEASAPVYVLHVTGFGCEVGAAVLPPLDCSGSRQVGFVRSTDEHFGLGIVTRAEAVNGFTLNGAPLPAADFFPVPGSNEEYYYLRQEFDTLRVPVATASILSNTLGVFQLSVINGGFSSGCRYGFFSAYDALNFTLGPDRRLCEGETWSLRPFPAPAEATYRWQDGSSEAVFPVDEAGQYWLELARGECVARDTVAVAYDTAPVFSLPPDTLLCDGEVLPLRVDVDSAAYRWSDGGADRAMTVSEAGLYWLELQRGACREADSIQVAYLSPPAPDLGPDTVICDGLTLPLSADWPQSIYRWQDGHSAAGRLVEAPGLYAVTITNACGEAYAQRWVDYEACRRQCPIQAPNAFSPNGDRVNDRFTVYPPPCVAERFTLRIFDRWGGLVFEADDPTAGWDGHRGGQAAPGGIYTWVLRAELVNEYGEGVVVEEGGAVLLVR